MIDAWKAELKSLPEDDRAAKLKNKDKLFFDWYDMLIGRSQDIPRLLHIDGIREIIEESFRHFDGLRYNLLCYCIMPNHVHVLIYPLVQEDGKIFPISHIIYTWKKFTAAKINQMLGKQGNLWQKEAYDSLVRIDTGLGKVLDYIVNNPVKAGLVGDWQDWKGTFVKTGVVLECTGARCSAVFNNQKPIKS